jgi:hypothetical protein
MPALAAPCPVAIMKSTYLFLKELHMSTITRFKSKSILQPGDTTLFSKMISFAVFVAATLLMLEMRVALDAATSGDKSDGAYVQGM